MTVREEAYHLIDRLQEDSVKAVIQIMIRMTPDNRKHSHTIGLTSKMKAFQELQTMRKESAKYDFSPEERITALEDKFGSFPVKKRRTSLLRCFLNK